MHNTFPPELSPEVATWLRLQTTIAAGRITEPLRAEVADLDGFLNGLLIVVSQLVPALVQTNPTVGDALGTLWRQAAERYEALSAGEAPREGDEPVAQLEVRHLVYRACEERGLWEGRRASEKTCSARGARRQVRRRLRH